MSLIFFVVTAVVVAPQVPAAQGIAGQVVYASGVALAGVEVSLVGEPPLTPQSTKTGADGTYRFASVPDGRYSVSFQSPGFKRAVRAGVIVRDGSAIRVDMVMELGSVAPVGGPAVILSTNATYSRQADASVPAVLVRVQTQFGSIDIAVDVKRAPVTSANFLKYVDAGLYDGGRFHRATRPDNYKPAPPNRPAMELIQGGISPEKKGQGFPAIPLERTSVTGIKHVRGVVSMARGGPDTATSDFFILLDDQPSLDFGGLRFDDAQGAAAFGTVVAGLDIVAKIQQQPVDGQNLSPPVPILSVRRISK